MPLSETHPITHTHTPNLLSDVRAAAINSDNGNPTHGYTSIGDKPPTYTNKKTTALLLDIQLYVGVTKMESIICVSQMTSNERGAREITRGKPEITATL